MKYAAKPQHLNPDKPAHADPWDVWECIEFDGTNENQLRAAGWFISDEDNFAEWFQIKKICPAKITPRQARQALILQNINEEMIQTAFDSLPSPTRELAKTEWEYSIEIQRDRRLTNEVAAMLGWTQFQLDQLFVFAGSL